VTDCSHILEGQHLEEKYRPWLFTIFLGFGNPSCLFLELWNPSCHFLKVWNPSRHFFWLFYLVFCCLLSLLPCILLSLNSYILLFNFCLFLLVSSITILILSTLKLSYIFYVVVSLWNLSFVVHSLKINLPFL